MTREVLQQALEAFQAIPEDIEGYLPEICTDAVIAIKAALAQPTTGDYAMGYTEGFNDACKPVQPNAIALIKECQTALAEELAACDIDPPLHHILQAHDKCVAWLVGAGVLVYCTACERNVRGPCNSADCSIPDPTPQPVQPEQESDAVAVLTEEGWMWDGDQWQRPAQQETD